jgi:hypothetical protein
MPAKNSALADVNGQELFDHDVVVAHVQAFFEHDDVVVAHVQAFFEHDVVVAHVQAFFEHDVVVAHVQASFEHDVDVDPFDCMVEVNQLLEKDSLLAAHLMTDHNHPFVYL